MRKISFQWKPGFGPGGLISRAARLSARIGDSQLEKLGVTTGQLPVLALLKDGSSLSQKDLADLVRVEQPTMALTLTRMERDGLITRQPNPDDKRSSLITITTTALSKMPEIFDILRQGADETLANFSDAEKEMLTELLKRYLGNLEEMLDKRSRS
ncbi:MarR family winged helix-turn-helix transcriptional regulator [Abditibacterium utsteinense]|nr:MarR family transcriptional regulator [Abditibacterium utsteinense]